MQSDAAAPAHRLAGASTVLLSEQVCVEQLLLAETDRELLRGRRNKALRRDKAHTSCNSMHP